VACGVTRLTSDQEDALLVFDRPDPYRSVARELLMVLADEGRPMTLRALQARMSRDEAARQLSVARVAGFVRATASLRSEPAYAPTALGTLIARNARAERVTVLAAGVAASAA
jgi:hypothetical protein